VNVVKFDILKGFWGFGAAGSNFNLLASIGFWLIGAFISCGC